MPDVALIKFPIAGSGPGWATILCLILVNGASAQIAGRNINMVSGSQWPGGDPFLQRQNEPSLAVSTRNSTHLLAGANDYRTVDLPGLAAGETSDGWLGLFKSFDGGQTWISTLVPGYPQDTSSTGTTTPLKAFQAGADPLVRAGTNGLFYYSALAFNRGFGGASAIMVSRLIDNNNNEAGDPIQFLGTTAVAGATGSTFLDKPWMAVDIPRAGALSCQVGNPIQVIPAGNVYVAYTAFTNDELHGAIMFARSLDCGITWSTPAQIAPATSTNQGATIAIDPNTGSVYVAWRRFASATDADAIMFSKSADGGQTFTAPVVASPILPFDQPTSSVSFRTNSYPTMAVDGAGLIYLAWAQRSIGPAGDARIVVSTSAGGLTWSAPVPADNPAVRGHQIMPSLTFAAGRLALLYYDLRDDTTTGIYTALGGGQYSETRTPLGDLATTPAHPEKVFTNAIVDASPDPAIGNLLRRHTMDVRVAQAPPGIALHFTSSKVSQYPIGSRPNSTVIEQLQTNVPNLPMFARGSVPFIGDYVDIAALSFVRSADGTWTFNTAPSTAAVFNAVWTDNRDVRPPSDGNWSHYTPIQSLSSQLTSIFDPSQQEPACQPGLTGSRNQNIYFSRITQGLFTNSPGNSKPLNAQFPRAFVISVQNTTAVPKTFRLTIANQPPAGRASFSQRSTSSTSLRLDVSIPPLSSISRTVFVQSSTVQAQVRVDIVEVTGPNGSVVGGGLQSSVLLNPDPTNPVNQAPGDAEIYDPDVSNSDVSNPDVSNPNITNPDVSNPDVSNVVVENPDVSNPDVSNPDVSNPDVSNPDVSNPDVSNPDVSNGIIKDVTWVVTNRGNTHSSYTVKTVLAQSFPTGFTEQLIINKLYTTPVASGCTLALQTTTELLTNIVNPVFSSPASIANPDVSNPAITDATLALGPNETARITLRVVNPDKTTNSNFDPIKAVVTAVTSHAVDTTNFVAGGNQPPVGASQLLVVTNALPAGLVGAPYPATTLLQAGGKGPITWSLAPGSSLPGGLSMASNGVISGLPSAAGTFGFTVKASDSGLPQQTALQTLTIVIAPVKALVITSPSVPNGYVGLAYNFTLTASGGLGNRSWSISSGSLPPGVTMGANGVFSGAPLALGAFTMVVTVTDSSPVPLTATHQFTLQVVPYTLVFSTQPAATASGQPIPASVKVLDGFGNGVAGVPVTLALASGGARFFDAVNDFSIAGNPNGPWVYGQLIPGFVALANSLPASVCTSPAGGECWTQGSSFPAVATIVHNTTPNPLLYRGTILQPPNVLDLIAQDTSPAVRFVAPASDTYTFNGQFTRTDTSPNPVTVRVVQNGSTSQFSSSNFSDPFNPQTFSFSSIMSAGSTMDFIVQPFSGSSPFSDLATGLAVTVTGTGATLQGTTTVASGANGIAVFGNISIAQTGTYTLKALQPSSATATSAVFTIF